MEEMEEVPRREFLKSVKKIDWPGHGANPRCVRVEDPKGRFMNICHPDISDVVIDKAKFNLAELHRLPGHQEISVDFEGPCEVRDRILRCPPSAKASWELEAEKKELPPRGTGLETGRAGERRAGKPRTEEERRLRHWGHEAEIAEVRGEDEERLGEAEYLRKKMRGEAGTD